MVIILAICILKLLVKKYKQITEEYKRQRVSGSDSSTSLTQGEDELETYLFRLGDPNDLNRVKNRNLKSFSSFSIIYVREF